MTEPTVRSATRSGYLDRSSVAGTNGWAGRYQPEKAPIVRVSNAEHENSLTRKILRHWGRFIIPRRCPLDRNGRGIHISCLLYLPIKPTECGFSKKAALFQLWTASQLINNSTMRRTPTQCSRRSLPDTTGRFCCRLEFWPGIRLVSPKHRAVYALTGHQYHCSAATARQENRHPVN